MTHEHTFVEVARTECYLPFFGWKLFKETTYQKLKCECGVTREIQIT